MKTASLLFACAMLCACGGAAGTVGEPAPTLGDPPASTGRPAAPSPSAEAPPVPTREGHVTIHTSEHVREPGMSGFAVSSHAWFGVREGSGRPLSDCELVVDPFGEASTVPDPASDSAGLVEVGITLGTEKNELNLPFDPAKKRYESFGAGANGPATETIRVRARGGTVPAFTVDLAPQVPVEVLSPVAGQTIGPRDLSISWTSDPGAELAVIDLAAESKDVRCAVTKGNAITVPAALITALLDGTKPDAALQLMVFTAKSTKVDVGDYRIRVQHDASMFVGLKKE